MGRWSNRGLTLGILVITFLGTSAVKAAPPPPTSSAPSPRAAVTALLSVATDGTHGNADSFAPELSADGSTVAFVSLATNLAAPEPAQVASVFVRDPRTGRTERVSDGVDGLAADGDSRNPSLSGDGLVVAFESAASNLVGGDTNGTSDVFVHDRVSGRTTRVSVDSGGAQADGPSGLDSAPALSADGQIVAFASRAGNLVTPGTDVPDREDVFVYDRARKETNRVSVGPGGVQPSGDSYSPALSADGRYVAFASEATNLVRGDTNGATDIFVHDRETGRTTRVTVASDGTQVNGDSFTPSISGDGRFVAFTTDAGNVVAGDDNRASDVFVHDGQTGRTVLVSVASHGHPSARGSFAPCLSADGRTVAFVTDGPLVADDTNNSEDVYVADLATGGLRRVSVASDGTEGDGPSLGPALSGDGTAVAFESLASNLVVADSNAAEDVFWRR